MPGDFNNAESRSWAKQFAADERERQQKSPTSAESKSKPLAPPQDTEAGGPGFVFTSSPTTSAGNADAEMADLPNSPKIEQDLHAAGESTSEPTGEEVKAGAGETADGVEELSSSSSAPKTANQPHGTIHTLNVVQSLGVDSPNHAKETEPATGDSQGEGSGGESSKNSNQSHAESDPEVDAFILFNERELLVPEINTLLTSRGVKTYFWQRDIAPGEEWERTEAKQLRSARVVLLFIGREGWGPNHLQIAARAQNWQRPMIAVMVGEPPRPAFQALGGFLRNRRYVDLKVVTEEAVEGLVAAIRAPQEELPQNPQLYGSDEKFSAPAKTCLRAEVYADVISRIVVGLANKDSFSFALLAPWGRGKTYLMRLVEERLALHSFSVVTFSAWKYRTTPELWAHLYETLRRHAAGDWLLPLRIGTLRRGIWPATVSLFGLAWHLSTGWQRWNAAEVAIWVLGVSGVAFVATAVYQLVKTSIRLHGLYWQMPRHQERLGLQFAIGEDLKSLLRAWMPEPWTPAVAKSFCMSHRFVGAAAYILALCFIWRQITLSAVNFSSENLTLGLSDLGLLLVILLTGSVLPILVLLKPALISLRMIVPVLKWLPSQNRVLLVVDDLDRCQPEQMLEIIECLQLFLDEDGIKERLKLAMLVEEEILENAILRKYRQVLTPPTGGYQITANWESGLIRDNLEKLFLLWLRLPRLSHLELHEMFVETCAPLCAPVQMKSKPGETVSSAASQAKETTTTSLIKDHNRDLPSTSTKISIQKQSIITLLPNERDALTEVAATLFAKDRHHEWGPRAVRSFVFRYQLARMLLTGLGHAHVEPQELVRALCAARDTRVDQQCDFDEHVWRIASQVS
jgi:KAP family P-loop domain/TIR domain